MGDGSLNCSLFINTKTKDAFFNLKTCSFQVEKVPSLPAKDSRTLYLSDNQKTKKE